MRIVTQQLADETPVCPCGGYLEAGRTLLRVWGEHTCTKFR
jgi:hypothetical protein